MARKLGTPQTRQAARNPAPPRAAELARLEQDSRRSPGVNTARFSDQIINEMTERHNAVYRPRRRNGGMR